MRREGGIVDARGRFWGQSALTSLVRNIYFWLLASFLLRGHFLWTTSCSHSYRSLSRLSGVEMDVRSVPSPLGYSLFQLLIDSTVKNKISTAWSAWRRWKTVGAIANVIYHLVTRAAVVLVIVYAYLSLLKLISCRHLLQTLARRACWFVFKLISSVREGESFCLWSRLLELSPTSQTTLKIKQFTLPAQRLQEINLSKNGYAWPVTDTTLRTDFLLPATSPFWQST